MIFLIESVESHLVVTNDVALSDLVVEPET